MKRVTGVGGVFFKANDPTVLGNWYREHLGLEVSDWGGSIFSWGGPTVRLARRSGVLQERHHLLRAWNRKLHGEIRVADLHGAGRASGRGCNVEDRTEASEHREVRLGH